MSLDGRVRDAESYYNLLTEGFIRGFVPSNATDADHDLTLSTGACVDSSGVPCAPLWGSLTKQIDATWAEGNDAGGAFSGATIGNTDDYYIILIRKQSDPSVIDWGYDDNSSGTNKPDGWSVVREVFRGMTDGSGNLRDIIVVETAGGGLKVKNKDASIGEFSDQNPGVGEVTKTLSLVPPNSEALMGWQLSDSTPAGVTHFMCYETDKSNPTVVQSNALMTVFTDAEKNALVLPLIVDSSRQVKYKLSSSTADAFVLAKTIGYQLERA